MAILQKNNQGVFQSTGGVGEMGTWIDQQTGAGYSGPKRKITDVAYKSQVGQTQSLNQNPTIPVNPQNPPASTIPIAPQQNSALNPQQNQGGQTQDNQSPMDKFNMAILDMLQKAQNSGGNEDLYKRQRELQRKQISSGIDYSGTEGLSPGAQENIAAGRAGEYSTEIDSIGAKIKASDARLQNFESILGQVRAIGNDLKIKPSQEILQKYIYMLEKGGDWSTDVPDDIKEYVMAETNPDTWTKNAQAISKAKQADRTPQQGPTSYQEWSLAGGQQGTGKTYAEFLQTSKPPTQAQYTVAAYAQRVSQSGDIINDMESIIAGYNPFQYSIEKSDKTPNWAKSSNIKSIEQAERNFINAVLRRESGAAIAPSEFTSAEKQYFPLPRDDAKILEQKRQNRKTTLQGLINASGSAYEGEDIRTQVIGLGYDYDAMSQQYSDEEIKQSLEL